MIGNERHTLVAVIGGDILRHGKLPLILFIGVLVSAVLVVTTTHKTRSRYRVAQFDSGRECVRRSQPRGTNCNREAANAARRPISREYRG